MLRNLPLAALLLLVLVTPKVVHADDVSVAEDGTVLMKRFVPVAPAALLKVLVDPTLSADLSPDVISKEVLEGGPCPVYRVATKGMTRPLVYDFRSCTTASGIDEELVASDDFDAFACRWSLRAVEGGTEVTYKLLVRPRLNVPHRLIRVGQRRSMRATLDRLAERAGS